MALLRWTTALMFTSAIFHSVRAFQLYNMSELLSPEPAPNLSSPSCTEVSFDSSFPGVWSVLCTEQAINSSTTSRQPALVIPRENPKDDIPHGSAPHDEPEAHINEVRNSTYQSWCSRFGPPPFANESDAICWSLEDEWVIPAATESKKAGEDGFGRCSCRAWYMGHTQFKICNCDRCSAHVIFNLRERCQTLQQHCPANGYSAGYALYEGENVEYAFYSTNNDIKQKKVIKEMEKWEKTGLELDLGVSRHRLLGCEAGEDTPHKHYSGPLVKCGLNDPDMLRVYFGHPWGRATYGWEWDAPKRKMLCKNMMDDGPHAVFAGVKPHVKGIMRFTLEGWSNEETDEETY